MWKYLKPKKSGEAASTESIEEAVEELSARVSDEEKKKLISSDFLPKAAKFASKLPFVRDLAAGYYCMADRSTPKAIKGAILIPLVYFVIPVDAVPDILPAAGFTDDIAVWLAAVKGFGGYINDDHYRSADELLETKQL